MKKLLLASALFLVTFILLPGKILAQGTFTCRETEQGPKKCIVLETHCDHDYAPDKAICDSMDSNACKNSSPFPCIYAPTSTPTPVPASTSTPGSANILCNGDNGINTAIGCIPINNTNDLIGFILKWAIGIGGGIAFLLTIYAGFMIMTSSGNPERLKAGQELLTSAIAGLIMLIFSVFILEIIGVKILQIPGFG